MFWRVSFSAFALHPLSKPCGVISSAKSCPVARVFVWDARGPDPNAEPPVVGIILKQNSIFRLLDLVRFSRGFPGNGLGTFPSDFMHPGRADSTPVPTRLRRVAHSNGFAVRPGIRTVVCLAAMTCRQRATRRSRVGTLPQADTAGGSRSKSAISISAEVRKSESLSNRNRIVVLVHVLVHSYLSPVIIQRRSPDEVPAKPAEFILLDTWRKKSNSHAPN